MESSDATLTIYALGEKTAVESLPPHVVTGSHAALRLTWTPNNDASAPKLSDYAQALSKLVALDKNDNALFRNKQLDALVASWQLTDTHSVDSGAAGPIIMNSNLYKGADGTLQIDLVQFQPEDPSFVALGTTLVDVQASGEALDKLRAALNASKRK